MIPATTPPLAAPTPTRRSLWTYLLGLAGGFLLLLVLLVAGLLLYASTARFANTVRRKVIAVLETSTGGRVELQSFRWSLLHLAVEADNLTIHGLEGPGETPYAHIDRLYLRAQILAFIHPKIALSYLEADRPVFHLIVYPDGSTNQPRPKATTTPGAGLPDTIFDLQIRRLEVNRGLALINQRAIPFNLRANDFAAVVTYAPATDHYLGELQVADLNLQRASNPQLSSKLSLQVEIARNAAEVKALHFSGGASRLDASGSIQDFAHPRWMLATQGQIDLRELTALAPVDGLRGGTANLNLQGNGTGDGQFSIAGNAQLTNGSYQTSYVTVNGANATTRLRITPDEIALDDVKARLRGEAGSVEAALRFLHWNAPEVGASAPAGRTGKKPPAVMAAVSIRARVRGMRLPTLLRVVAIRRYQNLGFDTAADGPVNIDWTGSGSDLTVGANLRLSAPRTPAAGQLPLSGVVDAKYFERNGTVQINRLEAYTPGTQAAVAGALAVYPITRPSTLQVKLSTTSLAEFDHALTDLGLAANGKKGVAAIPVRLHGEAEFAGAVTGSLVDPDVTGHVTATNFSTDFILPGLTPASASRPLEKVSVSRSPAPPPLPGKASLETHDHTIHWDRLDTTGEYSSSRISIQQATLSGGGATIQAQGALEAHRINRRRSAFDGFSAIDATANIEKASLGDLLAIAGQSLPVTGTVNVHVHAGGSLDHLNGGGDVVVQGGEIMGEPYRSLTAHLTFTGHRIDLVKLTLLQNGGSVIANGTFDLQDNSFLANLDATNFELARFHRLQAPGFPVTGQLKFDAHASGTLESPSVLLGVHLTGVTVQGQPLGGVEGVMHTSGSIAYFTAHSTLITARLDLSGQTVLRDKFETQARLAFAGLNIDPLLKAFHVQNLTGHSLIGGTVNLAGSAREPKQWSGDAEVNQFSLTLANLTLTSQGPLRASIRDGVVHLTQAHITGPDTNMTVTGSADLMGSRDLSLNAKGSINMKLAQTFDPDINSSGHVDFSVQAAGTLLKPSLTGQVRLTNVAMALNDVPTGISKLNGTLVFDQDRLEVQNLVGTTGGGQLKLSGFITYQNGIYGDLSATGKDIRIRYSGISATADTALHLQGSQANMLFSGNVQITRFIIGPNLDFAVFANSPVAAPPPNPNAPSNHVRLDIRITSAPQLDFQNSYAQLAGSVDLRIRGTIAQPAVLGRINITEGAANFAGTTYQLQHGEIYFTNPVRIEPIVDIDATTRIEEYDVTVGLHGSAAQLTPTFRSEPPLPQADVISLLALGRTQQEQQLYSQQQEQAGIDSTTNALLGGALNATVGNRVQKLFGVGSVKIDPTYLGNLGDSSARITVQQNISRNVQLTYATNVNATAEQLLQAQVNLTANISILAVRDESNVFSLVLKVHKRLR